MLQGLAHTICVYAKKASGGGADNTPDAVNWGNVQVIPFKKSGSIYTYNAQQITGISTSITLKTEFSNTGYLYLYYKIQSTSTVPSSNFNPPPQGYTNILHNGTITVSNNEWVVFGVNKGTTSSSTITVKNTSDSNTTLDTFTATTSSNL